jgi:hypothetical protein
MKEQQGKQKQKEQEDQYSMPQGKQQQQAVNGVFFSFNTSIKA